MKISATATALSGLLFACLCVPRAAHAAATKVSAAGVKLHSVQITLPPDDQVFPGGDKAQAINENCLTCHSASMVLMQPALPAAAWQTEVNKMIKVYKAPVAAADVPAILAYLTQLKPSD